ncbi:MAG: hypothetical protein HY706_17360 [Candidatus Hydrogenedentes bacterium]|nr:hypothetical protein [Candidatus Hydrogenedentota bacterium]
MRIRRSETAWRLPIVQNSVALFVILTFASTPGVSAQDVTPTGGGYQVTEIARGHSWVSPYWGYSTPKLVYDGKAYYTAVLWGDSPDSSEGVLYKFENGAWRAGARLPGIYQPATLLLDPKGRVLVAYTRSEKPAAFLRSKIPGSIDDLESVAAPADMPNAYYLGWALRERTVSLAYLTAPAYTMYLTTLDLATLTWTPSARIREGQVETKPKTAWTYPILVPSADGLHLVASNCPDGGEGNTYNEVWHQFYPAGAMKPAREEKVADAPVGHNAYAMDMLLDNAGWAHIVFMWNVRKYGEPLPEGSPPPGTYHAWRDPKTGTWERRYLSSLCIAGLVEDGGHVLAVTQQNGAVFPLEWQRETKVWKTLPPLCSAQQIPAGPSFMDVISPASGSAVPGLALVSDGMLPEVSGKRAERVVWAILPADR